MSQKFVINKTLPQESLEKIIKYEGEKQGFYVKFFCKYIYIKKIKYIYKNVMPVNFQVSFVGRIESLGEGSCITGKFDMPPLFYKILLIAYILGSVVLLRSSYRNDGTIFVTVYNILLMGSLFFIFLKINIFISRLLFSKRNKMVIDFLQSI